MKKSEKYSGAALACVLVGTLVPFDLFFVRESFLLDRQSLLGMLHTDPQLVIMGAAGLCALMMMLFFLAGVQRERNEFQEDKRLAEQMFKANASTRVNRFLRRYSGE